MLNLKLMLSNRSLAFAAPSQERKRARAELWRSALAASKKLGDFTPLAPVSDEDEAELIRYILGRVGDRVGWAQLKLCSGGDLAIEWWPEPRQLWQGPHAASLARYDALLHQQDSSTWGADRTFALRGALWGAA